MGQLSNFETTVLKHPDAAAVFAMWRDLKGRRPAPFRAELDAGKIGARAPCLAILEYVGPNNFRIRIAGDRLNKWFGLELRGMSALSLVGPEARNHLQGALNRVTAEPAAVAVSGAARRADGLSSAFEMILLPMRSDFGRIDRVLVGLWLIDAPGATGPLRLDPETFTVAAIEGPEGAGEPEARIEPVDGALADAEAAEAPSGEAGAALRAIEGGEMRSAARRGHLRLVKKH